MPNYTRAHLNGSVVVLLRAPIGRSFVVRYTSSSLSLAVCPHFFGKGFDSFGVLIEQSLDALAKLVAEVGNFL